VTALIAAAVAGYGLHLLYSALVMRWGGFAPGPAVTRRRSKRRSLQQWMAQAGLPDVSVAELGAVMALLAAVSAALGAVVFAAAVPAAVMALAGAVTPVASYRARRANRIMVAQEAWPRMIEEIRVMTGSLGRSVPQALFEVGGRGPVELRPAFEAARTEWLLTTDFDRTVALLKGRLADPTADATLETLLVAHHLGGTSLQHRLEALAIDRAADVHSRKDAAAKQAGVRFARKFVLAVPAGMAVVGLQIGDGRAAYRSAGGQLAVLIALAMVALCWMWAGRMLAIPSEQRVFIGESP
jgi:tight adherence protein B